MEIKGLSDKITILLKKYRYPLIVIAVGLVLMAIPELKNDEKVVPNVTSDVVNEESMEDKLSSILSQIEGAGCVKVLLTEATGEEIYYQTNDNNNTGENTNSKNADTVIITDAQRNQSGLIRQVNPPAYQGAVVVCQGADNPTVQLAIVDAVSKVTGLGANRISVFKMK